MDIAGVVFEIDPSPAELGAQRAARALDQLEQRTDQFVAKIQELQKQMAAAFSSMGGGRGGAAGGSSSGGGRSRQVVNEAEQLEAAQRKAADSALKLAQAQARLLQIQGQGAQAAQVLTSAINGSAASMQTLISAQIQLARLGTAGAFKRYSATIREAGESIQQTGYFLTGLAASLLSAGGAAVKSALDVDKNVNVLKAFTGSAEAAEKRYAQLIAISQKTPGLTSSLATTLDAQLRVAGVTEQAINRVLPAIGKLNAVSNFESPQRFAQNLIQLVTQNFERTDLKELVGQSPLGAQLVKKIFNVDSPINSEAIRASAQKLGITTVESFFAAFAKAAEEDQGLSRITESLGTRFAKLQDRVEIAIRPLGLAIIDALAPIVEKGVAELEKLTNAFVSLPQPVQQAIILISGLAVALGPLVVGLGALIQAAGAIGGLATAISGLAASGGAIGGLITTLAALGPEILAIGAALAIVAIAWAAYETAADKAAKVSLTSIQAQAAALQQSKDLAGQAGGLTDAVTRSAVEHEKFEAILRKLDPATRAYISAISDEKEAVRLLNVELAQASDRNRGVLEATARTLAAGFADASQQIEERKATIKQAQDEINASLNAGASSALKLIPALGRAYTRDLSDGIVKAEGDLKKFQTVQSESLEKLIAAANALGLNRDGFIDLARSVVGTDKGLQQLIGAYDAFKAKQSGAISQVDAMTAALEAQRRALADLGKALDAKDFKTVGSLLDQRIEAIAQKGLPQKQAIKEFQNDRKTLTDDNGRKVIDEAIKRKQLYDSTTKALKDIVEPPKASAKSGESLARQLRAANEELEKARIKGASDVEEKIIKNRLELNKAAYGQQLLSAEDYYARLQADELKLQDIAKGRLEAEIKAAQNRASQSKAGSPEAIREQAKILDLQKQIQILDLERPSIIRKATEELEKALKLQEKSYAAQLAAGAKFAQDLVKQQLDELRGKEAAQREAPNAGLKQAEIELQGLAAQGLIREQDLTDALILTRRKYRDSIIEAAEAKKLELEANTGNPNRFSEIQRLEEEIAGLHNLGAELTRTERLQKRFAEQTTIDYTHLNDGVEDFLAEQKSLTESFRDFRRNQVADVFGLIEKGVDKLTEKLGVLGGAVNQLLKDLLKLAATQIFKKLFGIDPGSGRGQQSFFSLPAGGGNAGGGGFSLAGLLNPGGGSQQAAFAGLPAAGGGGNFLTGGFAGGNPAQAILGGGSGGGAGVQGGSLSGLLRRIPGLGKLFGGGAATAGAVNGNIGGLPTIARPDVFNPALNPAAGAAKLGIGASLGATGLLAGGGLLGGFLGKGPIGQLAGQAGGALALGALGATGIFGGGVAAALPAFFSNPITAVIGGALLGVALLSRLFGGGEFKKFRSEVKKLYELDVKNNKDGQGVYAQVKDLGEKFYGKGKFGKHLTETLRTKEARALLAAYGEATGQTGNPLVKKAIETRELGDAGDPRNRFVIRRAFGGSISAGQPYIVGDAGKPEVFMPSQNGYMFPSIQAFNQELAASLRGARQMGGILSGVTRQLVEMAKAQADYSAPTVYAVDPASRARAAAVALPGAPSRPSASPQGPQVDQLMLGAIVDLHEAISNLKAVPPGHIVQQGLQQNPEAATNAVASSGARRSDAFNKLRDHVNFR